MFKKLFFIYNNKANYPELNAYAKYFKKYFDIELIEKKDLKTRTFDNKTILWFLMGFFPEKYKAGCIIHDYRSLSVGKLPRLKNWLKKTFNQKPDARIFLNQYICNELGFNDSIPYFFIDMGIPSEMIKSTETTSDIIHDFIYVGDISKERESDHMIQEFLKQYGTNKSFMVVGSYDISIYNKFKKYPNIKFTGRVPQFKVFELIKQSNICVNFIPKKYPYPFQTSTKLLEYAAMKKRILSTKTPAIEKHLHDLNIKAYLVDDYFFPPYDTLIKTAENSSFNVINITWDTLIKESKIEKFLYRYK